MLSNLPSSNSLAATITLLASSILATSAIAYAVYSDHHHRRRSDRSQPGSTSHASIPGLWVVGLGTQYPPHRLIPERLDNLANRFHDVAEKPGLEKLLHVNKRTGIETRAAVCTLDEDEDLTNQPEPPNISQLDSFFRKAGVELAVQACEKALQEWGGSKSDITHSVAVTCTNQGNPGYDVLVNAKLGLGSGVDRTLLHGVGCAGGVATLRMASQIAAGATAMGQPARVLAFACEICSPFARAELAAAAECDDGNVEITAALFSDAAAAFVLCNELGRMSEVGEARPLFRIVDKGSVLIQGTVDELTTFAAPQGLRTRISKDVPRYAEKAVEPLFETLAKRNAAKIRFQSGRVSANDFDWALHPGGTAIMDGVERTMGLDKHHLWASRKVYRTRGNSSSPTVLSVLDELRKASSTRDHIVVASFGPGMVAEMVFLKRCHGLT